MPAQTHQFHIHIDAQHMPTSYARSVREELRFADTNFAGHPAGYVHFEPRTHLTLKLRTREAFDATWSRLCALTTDSGFVGYIEGEYIRVDRDIPFSAFRDVPVPFHIRRKRLDPAIGERFRQSEIHLVYERERSDPRLTERLLRAGLYGAYIPKPGGEFVVLTMQGSVKSIEPLARALGRYVGEAGGAHACTLKEERAIKYRLYGIQTTELPEVADTIEYVSCADAIARAEAARPACAR